EAAARQHGLELHTLEREAEHLRDHLMIAGLYLTTEARHRALAIPTQEAVERLHRRMRKVWKHELGFDDSVRAGKRRVDVPVRAGHESGLACERTIFGDQLFTAASLCTGLVPGDAQEVTRFPGGPEAVRIHRNPGGGLPHIHDTADGARVGRVEVRDACTEMWRARDDDREHAALADVECELGPAVRLCRRVELFDGSIFPDEPESRRILELHVGRYWQPRGGFGELAEAALPSGACVPQYTAFNGDLARRNVPRLRRRV